MKFDILDLIYRVPNFLSDDECDSLVAEYEERKLESSYEHCICLLYTSPSPRDPKTSRMPSSA